MAKSCRHVIRGQLLIAFMLLRHWCRKCHFTSTEYAFSYAEQ